ncbi:peptidyl-prolyl cis-trans isomerase D [Klebsiella aerogenes]|nr:peptidyl-prolyl cis-trans isomerase D [Klebsiella aerogenes]
MQGDVVLVALDEVKAGNMPEEQKKAMVQGITQNNAPNRFRSADEQPAQGGEN